MTWRGWRLSYGDLGDGVHCVSRLCLYLLNTQIVTLSYYRRLFLLALGLEVCLGLLKCVPGLFSARHSSSLLVEMV